MISRVSISEGQSNVFCAMCPNCTTKDKGNSLSVYHVDVLIAGVPK